MGPDHDVKLIQRLENEPIMILMGSVILLPKTVQLCSILPYQVILQRTTFRHVESRDCTG